MRRPAILVFGPSFDASGQWAARLLRSPERTGWQLIGPEDGSRGLCCMPAPIVRARLAKALGTQARGLLMIGDARVDHACALCDVVHDVGMGTAIDIQSIDWVEAQGLDRGARGAAADPRGEAADPSAGLASRLVSAGGIRTAQAWIERVQQDGIVSASSRESPSSPLLFVWPGRLRFDRSVVREAWSALPQELCSASAVLRTARAWYRLDAGEASAPRVHDRRPQPPSGGRPEPFHDQPAHTPDLDARASSGVVIRETNWRLDSRLSMQLAPSIAVDGPSAIEARESIRRWLSGWVPH